jgi:hypothetical protein
VGSIVAGRTGSAYQGGALNSIFKTLDATYATLTMGCAYKTAALTGEPFLFYGPSVGLEFAIDSFGKAYFDLDYPGGSNIVSPPSTFVFNINQWYYVEAQAAIVDGSPPHLVASARVNGAEFLTWDYTAASSLSGLRFASVAIQGPGGGLSANWDDLYVTDTEFLGDIRIGVLYPNAAGDSTAWTPNAGTNWSQVEEHPADDDTSYVSASSVGLKDLYNLDDIDPAFVGTIKGVQALWLTKKSDEGDGAVKGVWKSGGTEITQADGHNYLAPGGFYPSATSWLYDIQTKRASLFTAVDWTKAEIDALQLGIIRTV